MSQRYNSVGRAMGFFRCQTIKLILEEFGTDARPRTYLFEWRSFLAAKDPEKEFQRKLNQPRVPGAVLVIAPNFLLLVVQHVASGEANCVRLRMLKNSVRNSRS
jgi:hypothetical protein